MINTNKEKRMNLLNDLGIAVGTKNNALKVFDELYPSFLEVKYKKPSQYVQKYWDAFQMHPKNSRHLSEKIFKYILATLFVRENILPFHIDAKLTLLPSVSYDFMFYSMEKGVICISAKTSLRERYKQADLEAIALKYVHRKSLCFLLTMDKGAALSVNKKIKTGDVIGLDRVTVASEPEFDQLITEIKSYKLSEPPTVKVIQSTQIVTLDKLKAVK